MTITITGGVNNASLQVGDKIYYIPVGSIQQAGNTLHSGDYYNNAWTENPGYYLVGELSSFTSTTITIDTVVNTPGPDDFIMFSKNKSVNNTSLIGYYAEVRLKNNSTAAAELFSLSSEITVSSK
jgi:hypothetical protein